jgi:transposase
VVFRGFVVLCRKLGLLRRELPAVDGRPLNSVNNPRQNFSCDTLAAKIAKSRDQRHPRNELDELNASGESQVSLTDPDAVAMVMILTDRDNIFGTGKHLKIVPMTRNLCGTYGEN